MQCSCCGYVEPDVPVQFIRLGPPACGCRYERCDDCGKCLTHDLCRVNRLVNLIREQGGNSFKGAIIMPKVRAKFIVSSVESYGSPDNQGRPATHSVKPILRAVMPTDNDPKADGENQAFHKYTPSGELWMQVDNPDVFGFFEPGAYVYLTLERA